jgi:GT2 family glycosyltransferase
VSAMPSLTSVITVNFNAGDLLLASARAVLDSRAPVELIVIDNGSSDGSIAQLRRAVGGDPRVRIVENGANLGFARANNIAVDWATGDHLLFLNPDCLVRPETIGAIREALDAHPRAAMAGCLILNPDGSEQAGCRRSVPTPWRALVRALGLARVFPHHRKLFDDFVLAHQPLPSGPAAVEAISGAFMFVRRAAMDAVGRMDEGYFLHCEDLDWCMRFRAAGREILFVPTVAVTHHKGYCSRKRSIRVLWHMHRGMVRFYGKFFRHQYPAPLLWAVTIGVWARFGIMAARTALRREQS